MGIYLKSDGFRLGSGGPAGIQVMREPNFAAGEGCAVLLCSLQEFQQTKQTGNPISSSCIGYFMHCMVPCFNRGSLCQIPEHLTVPNCQE